MHASRLSMLFNVRVLEMDTLIRNSSEFGRAFMVFGTAREWAERHRRDLPSTLTADVLQAREDDYYTQIVKEDSAQDQMRISHKTQMALRACSSLGAGGLLRRRVNAHELLLAVDYDLSCGLRQNEELGQALHDLVRDVRATKAPVMLKAEDDTALAQNLAQAFMVEAGGMQASCAQGLFYSSNAMGHVTFENARPILFEPY